MGGLLQCDLLARPPILGILTTAPAAATRLLPGPIKALIVVGLLWCFVSTSIRSESARRLTPTERDGEPVLVSAARGPAAAAGRDYGGAVVDEVDRRLIEVVELDRESLVDVPNDPAD